MSHRYAPLPNPRSNERAQNEMDAAFDDSEDEDELDDRNAASESQPLNPIAPLRPQIPGTYDFENIDYDYPPPGSPPAPSTTALPNEHGNSNGVIPSFSAVPAVPPGRNWFNRAAASILPSKLANRLGLAPRRPVGVFGGGLNNDGVFANVTAKPSPPVVQATQGTFCHSFVTSLGLRILQVATCISSQRIQERMYHHLTHMHKVPSFLTTINFELILFL
jgi:hypothetical protein